jgi:very-short-patch-repair endonuclease
VLGGTTPLKLVGGREVRVAPGTPDQRLVAAAAMQSARISRAQLIVLGFNHGGIARRIQAARLYLIHRGVYGVGPRVEVELGDETAALLAIGPPVALSHESAAHLYGIWKAIPPIVHVAVPGHRSKSRQGIVVHRSNRLTAADVTTHRGLPVTTPARILLDLADRHPVRTVERAFDEALARRLVSPAKVRDLLTRSPGRAGTPLLGALIDPDRRGGVTIGEAEERLLALVRHAHLPDPQRNARIGPYTVDFLWPEQHVAVEFDSFTWHGGPSSFRRDRAKDAYLNDRAINLHRVTWAMLEDPVPLIARLVRAISL